VTWDAEHGPSSARAAEFAERIRYLRELCRDLGRPRVLDLGCATGQTLLHLADVIVTGIGVDAAPAMIAEARRNVGTAPVRCCISDAVEFCADCTERFDLVLFVGVLEHLADPTAALAGAKRVLATSGRVVVIMPHPWGPVFRLKHLLTGSREVPSARHLSPMRLRVLATWHGLELVAIQALAYAPWPALGVALGGLLRDPARAARRKPFAGMLRGAYAAEFRHSESLDKSAHQI
jgi:ArsR family transcriptional regulator